MNKSMFCVKCKVHRKCKAVKVEKDVRGKHRLHGKCGSCGTHCFQYVSAAAAKRSRSRSRSRSRGRK